MKKMILYIVVLISIPFFVVTFFKVDNLSFKEVKLNYLSNVIVKVKRGNDNVEDVFLEEYVVGVVGGEMPASFEMEALKAQSVASRTYVLKKILNNDNREYDVVDTVSNQVYLDDDELKDKWGSNYGSYINKIREAVNDTSMEYLVYDGEIIDAMFFSTSNGYTEDSGVVFSTSLPYLRSVLSEWDKDVAPMFSYSTDMSLQEFYDRLDIEYSGELVMEVLERSDSNRIVKMRINGVEMLGKDIYKKLGLRSLDFSLKQVGNNINIETKGYGHGVGMSQYGAHGMAKNGYNYKEILSHYYSDTDLVKFEN